ncbi:alpha/beta fold hydrolase [Myxosarcina sp. GI1]|uniref:alpha/beta fold hydrolase n=1 Tax=Myxosarcina sp. GI1 TaxID=1541065 RepID=UPI00055DD412|nr:alpha/beta hydrolase [Myxosarcina sp. GI1]
MPELQHENAYFYSPQENKPNCPLLIFLPGLDETGKELMSRQTASLEVAFNVRCFVIPPEDLDNWELLAESVLALIEDELKSNPKCSVYLCGESFGGCLALKVLEQAPKLFEKIILVNPASSFHRVPLLNFGSLLFPLTPDFFYNHSAFLTLPFLAPINRISSQARQDLADTIKSAPKQTAQQRLAMMREFELNEAKLKQITQPVLLIGSEQDLILPSVEEVRRLAKIFPQATVVTLPHSGHACLVEEDINLYRIMEANSFVFKK